MEAAQALRGQFGGIIGDMLVCTHLCFGRGLIAGAGVCEVWKSASFMLHLGTGADYDSGLLRVSHTWAYVHVCIRVCAWAQWAQTSQPATAYGGLSALPMLCSSQCPAAYVCHLSVILRGRLGVVAAHVHSATPTATPTRAAELGAMHPCSISCKHVPWLALLTQPLGVNPCTHKHAQAQAASNLWRQWRRT